MGTRNRSQLHCHGNGETETKISPDRFVSIDSVTRATMVIRGLSDVFVVVRTRQIDGRWFQYRLYASKDYRNVW